MASEGDESAFAAPSEMEGQALGDIPEHSDYEATNTDADNLTDAADIAKSPEGIVGGSVLDKDVDALAEEGSEMDENTGTSASTEAQKLIKKKTKKYQKKIYVWMPMNFPAVPPKGGFDVTRLRASKYFFH